MLGNERLNGADQPAWRLRRSGTVGRGGEASPQATPERTGERYVALGDSYTIGEGVAEAERWPNLLTAHLQGEGIGIGLSRTRRSPAGPPPK